MKRSALLQAFMVLWMWFAVVAHAHADAGTVCAQPGNWCEPAAVAYSNGWYSNSPRYPTADEVCRSYNMQGCRAGVDPVYGRGCYCTVEGREYMYQNWYVAHRPSQACPTRLPNYTDDGWSVEVVNPVCYGPTTISTEEQSCSVGNPTLPGTGTKLHSETDYVPSFSHPIPFERHYRSKHSISAIQTANGWLHSYSARLYQPALSTSVYALRPSGEIVRFTKNAATSTWQSENGELLLSEQSDAAGVPTGWRLTQRSDNTSDIFDKTGRLTHIEVRNGWKLTLGYNVNGQLEGVTNHFGRRLTLAYDSAGRLTSMTTPGGDTTRYSHDAQGNLLSVTWPDGNIKRYHYEDGRFPRALTGITDETGQRIGSYTYDAQGRVSETQRASGVDRLQFSYGQDAAGAPQTTITDFSSGTPTTRTYNFVQQGRVLRPSGVSSPCPLCGSTARSTQYDAAGRKIREVSHDGSVIFYTYNAAGQEAERATFPASFSSAATRPALSNATSVVSTMWHGTWNLPVRIAEPGRSTTYSYSNQALAATSTYATTDTTGALKFNGTATGPSASTQYGYNANNLNTSITELTNGVQTQRWNLTYNAAGDLISITDVTGGNQSATLINDAQGRLTRINASNGAVASYTWNVHGQLAVAAMPGFTATLTYDSRKLLTDVRLSTGQWLRVTYSTSGEPVSVQDSTGQVQQVSGLGSHWLQSADPWAAAQTLLGHALREGNQRMLDALLPQAVAQPLPVPVPTGIANGLAAAGAGSVTGRADMVPASGACCGGTALPSARDMQQRLQRTLPFTLMATAAEAMETLTADILILRAGAQLRKRMLCPDEPYAMPLPPGCQEAHHIVAVAASGAQRARIVLAQVGIDINSPINGVWMECGRHRKMHTGQYYNQVNSLIEETNPRTKANVEFTLLRIRAMLRAGVL